MFKKYKIVKNKEIKKEDVRPNSAGSTNSGASHRSRPGSGKKKKKKKKKRQKIEPLKFWYDTKNEITILNDPLGLSSEDEGKQIQKRMESGASIEAL
jgi:hypothetical protein